MQTNVIEYLERGLSSYDENKIAVVDGDDTYTHRELEVVGKKIAYSIMHKINILNVPIAVFLPKCKETIVANIGIIYSGNIYTNIDIKLPDERLKNIFNNIQPKLVISVEKYSEKLSILGIKGDKILCIDKIIKSEIEYDDQFIFRRLHKIIDTDPLCIINTSGSTGTPKGVVINHRSVIDFIDEAVKSFMLDGTEIIGSLSPFYFDIYTLELYLCLAKGATIVILPEQLAIFPIKLVEYMKKYSISFIFWVPTIMVNIANMDIFRKINLNCLKKILFAGEVFPTKHFNYWRKYIPAAMFANLYGPIEITVDCLYYIVNRDFSDEEPLPIGYPFKNTDVLILNENNELAACNEQGELCVRGSSLAMGYWNDPEKTDKAFVQNPLNKNYPELIYRTGDIVYKNDKGEIMFLGRKDYQIKHMGYRIELNEIEHVILGLNFIKNACVLYNKQNKEISLFYESEKFLETASIRKAIAKVLPKYMFPTVFYKMESMPRNSNGKIDRQKLFESLEVK